MTNEQIEILLREGFRERGDYYELKSIYIWEEYSIIYFAQSPPNYAYCKPIPFKFDSFVKIKAIKTLFDLWD